MKPELGLIILAGGKSSRMGQDKGLMDYEGKPMILHVINALQKISKNIVIIANNEEYAQFGFPTYNDIYKETGPIGGIFTALTHSDFDQNLIISCDSPNISHELLSHIINESVGYDITIPVNNGKSHQLIALYSKNCLPVLKSQIEGKNYKLRDCFSYLNVNLVDCEQFSETNFKNINSKEDIC